MSTSSISRSGATRATRSPAPHEVRRSRGADHTQARPSRRRARPERPAADAWARAHDVLAAHSTRTGRARRSASRPGRLGTGLRRCPRTPRRWPTATPAGRPGRTSWRRARDRPAPPRSSASVRAHSPSAQLERMASADGAVAPLDLAPPVGPRPGPSAAAAPAVGQAPGHRRGGVVGEAPAPSDHVGPPNSGTCGPRAGPATPRATGPRPVGPTSASGRWPRAPRDAPASTIGLPAGAAAQVGQQGRLDRGSSVRGRRPVLERGQTQDDARACRTRTGWRRSRQRPRPSAARSSGSSPSTW